MAESIYRKASLAMIPYGAKEYELPSIKPTDGSGDFTFSRGSDIQATRVNSSGLIEKAKVNLLLQSNSFDTTWTNVLSTETGGQAGYDGTNDAWLLQASSTGGYISQTNTTSAVQTFSVYAKGGNVSWIRMVGAIGGSSPSAYFDLSGAGAVGTTNLLIDSNIEDIGGGWYRCSITFNQTLAEVRFVPASADGVQGVSGENILIQDAQLNYGLIAQDYVDTTIDEIVDPSDPMRDALVKVQGLTADLPRLDYSGGASCPSLLLEPSRTNLLTQSEYFGAWTGSAVYSANTTISPSGYQDAATLNDNTTGYLDRRLNASITANATHTFTFFVKKTTGSLTHYAGMAVLLTGGATRVDYGIINTTTGEINRDVSSNVNSASYSSVSYGDYWRVIMTFTDNQSNTLCTSIVYPAISTNGTSISPSAQGSNVFWGAQLEAGSYPTSYIPTYSAAANRGGDLASKTGLSSSIGQTEGTAFVEFDISVNDGFDDGFPSLIHLSDGTTDNRLSLFLNDSGYTPSKAHLYVRTTAGVQAQIIAPSSITTGHHKIAFAYANNDFVLYMDGVQLGTDTSGSVPACSVVSFAGGTGSVNPAENETKQSLVFPTRLTNAELAALTTI